LALLALALPGCGTERVPEAPPVASGPSLDPDRSARARRELTTLRELTEADPAIAATLALTGRTPSAEARIRWKSGRAALRHLVERHELARIVAELTRDEPTPEGFAELCRLALVARLLDGAHPPEPEPLFPAGGDPGIERALARGVEVRIEPAIDGRASATLPEGRDLYMKEVSADGRRWRALRPLEAAYIQDGPGRGYNSRIWRQTPTGERFRDPTEGIPSVMLGSVYQDRDRARLELAPDRIETGIEAGGGDLHLLLLAWNLQGTTHPVLDLVGRDLTVPVLVEPPPGAQAVMGLPENVAAGLAIRIRKAVIPAGLRKLVVRMVAPADRAARGHLQRHRVAPVGRRAGAPGLRRPRLGLAPAPDGGSLSRLPGTGGGRPWPTG
jgi:hypothetical protein